MSKSTAMLLHVGRGVGHSQGVGWSMPGMWGGVGWLVLVLQGLSGDTGMADTARGSERGSHPHPCAHPPPQDWFMSRGGSEQSIKRMWDPIGG